jgi:hypothetical protein
MAHTFALTSPEARLDAIQFLERAARVNNASARLIASAGYVQIYVGVLFPRGLLDQTPTVLGLRVFEVATPVEFDVIVPLESLIHRLTVSGENGEDHTRVPAEVASLSWAAITPPREGWRRRRNVTGVALTEAAETGIAKVAQAVPDSIGEAVLQKVRADVWGTMLPAHKRIPAGAGFAADALGFLPAHWLQVHTVDNWIRLSSKNGYVLVKYPGANAFADEEFDED